MSKVRARWAAVGAAVAVTLGAGGVSLGQATLDSDDKPVFVAITPCRLVDTRPGDNNVGGRTTPLTAGDTLALQVTGSTGECAGIPSDAIAAAMNVTAIQGTARSFLTIYPADADLPNASNLNWNGGDPPTPNKVDVKLGDTGEVKITNAFGTVHVAADLAGYYIDHTHDDRYYTKHQLDSTRAVSRTIYGAAASVLNGKPMSPVSSCVSIGPGTGWQAGTIVLPIDVPAGSVITSIDARVIDGSGPAEFSASFQRLSPSISGLSASNLRVTPPQGAASGPLSVELTPANPVAVTEGDTFAVEFSTAAPEALDGPNALCSVTIGYTLPAP